MFLQKSSCKMCLFGFSWVFFFDFFPHDARKNTIYGHLLLKVFRSTSAVLFVVSALRRSPSSLHSRAMWPSPVEPTSSTLSGTLTWSSFTHLFVTQADREIRWSLRQDLIPLSGSRVQDTSPPLRVSDICSSAVTTKHKDSENEDH